MKKRTWLITGVSSGFGKEIAGQVLEKGDIVIGTVRNVIKVQELIESYPDTFDYDILDLTDVVNIRKAVDAAFKKHGQIDVVISNAG